MGSGHRMIALALLLLGSRAAEAADPAWLASSEARVSAQSGLAFLRSVAVQVQDAQAVRDHLAMLVRGHATRIAAEGRVLGFLGLLPRGYDLGTRYPALLGGLTAGWYDPERIVLVLVRGREAGASATLEHELVHALQDQHYDPRTLTTRDDLDDDAALAMDALVEGEATVLAGTGTPGALPPGTPRLVARQLAFPYVQGAALVRHLVAQGAWPAVDAAWRTHPPLSTEQVLHPEKLVGPAADPPTRVDLDDLRSSILVPPRPGPP